MRFHLIELDEMENQYIDTIFDWHEAKQQLQPQRMIQKRQQKNWCFINTLVTVVLLLHVYWVSCEITCSFCCFSFFIVDHYLSKWNSLAILILWHLSLFINWISVKWTLNCNETRKKKYKNIENDSKIYGMAYVVRLRMKEKSFHFYGNDFHVSC